MNKLLFYIVDVFAEHKYEGNQLAVFRGGQHLSTEDMQHIAKYGSNRSTLSHSTSIYWASKHHSTSIGFKNRTTMQDLPRSV